MSRRLALRTASVRPNGLVTFNAMSMAFIQSDRFIHGKSFRDACHPTSKLLLRNGE